MNKPTDDEIDVMVAAYLGDCGPQATRVYSFTRAVLARWGQPAHSGEPVYAFRRKGLDDFCTCTEKRYAELSDKPTLFETRIFYTAPQPVVRELLTDEQIDQAIAELGLNYLADAHATNRAVLRKLCHHAHGIKGGQHDF